MKKRNTISSQLMYYHNFVPKALLAAAGQPPQAATASTARQRQSVKGAFP
ncbi:MAG: hypothetical protein LKK11_02465 [Acidaminococcus sp.]|nr:hypothetical protein [Acidaminococcus sp.]